MGGAIAKRSSSVDPHPQAREQNWYKVAVFGFLMLMFGVLPLIISGR